MVHGGALRADRGRVLSDLVTWVEMTFDHKPRDPALWTSAVTHSSREDERSYERLEFLGDRVLGLSIAEWLFAQFATEPEGKLTRRLNLLVSGATCAEIAREMGVARFLRLNKQAADDGAGDSDHVLGDVVESLLGALYLEAGLDAARAWVRRRWESRVNGADSAAKHPKSALQDWGLARNRGTPKYAVVGEEGPPNARRFTVAVTLGSEQAQAAGGTKREAETEAARQLLAVLEAQAPERRRRGSRPRAILPKRASQVGA